MSQSIREKVSQAIVDARTPKGRELRGDDLAHAIAYHSVEAHAAIKAFLEAIAKKGLRIVPDEFPVAEMTPTIAAINAALLKARDYGFTLHWIERDSVLPFKDTYRAIRRNLPLFKWDK